MKSIFNGHHINEKTSLHMIQFFDGQRIREVELMTHDVKICWTEKFPESWKSESTTRQQNGESPHWKSKAQDVSDNERSINHETVIDC